jgi:hypothetical protein
LNWVVGTLPVTAKKGTESKNEFARLMGKFADPGPQEVNVAVGWPDTR